MQVPHPKVFAARQSPPWGVEDAGEGFWLTPPQSMLDGEVYGLLEHDGLDVERGKLTCSGIRKYFVFCG